MPFLRLWHGRRSLDADLEGWGEDGLTFGIIGSIATGDDGQAFQAVDCEVIGPVDTSDTDRKSVV
jgi:hypothetical protein